MAAEIGDMVAVNGRVGEVVGMLDGRPVVQAFAPAGQEHLPPAPPFVADELARVVQKHWERDTSADRERQRLEAQAASRSEAIRAEHYARAAQADRAWHRERER